MGGEEYGHLDTVESYTEGSGWTEEPEMKLTNKKSGHCSVAFNDNLVVIGGDNGYPLITSEVLSFNVANMSGGWTTMPSLNTARENHACDTGNYEGQNGIFVTGGWYHGGDDGLVRLSSVEFYVAQEQRWIVLESLTTERYFHSLSIVSGIPYAAGGNGDISSVERLDGTTWEEAGSMKGRRYRHASVDIPAGVVTCKME